MKNKEKKISEIIKKDFSHSPSDFLSAEERKEKITTKLYNISNSIKLIERLGDLLNKTEKILNEIDKNRIKWWNWNLDDYKRNFDYRIRDINNSFSYFSKQYKLLRKYVFRLANKVNSNNNKTNGGEGNGMFS